jgi:hypothetical protein
LPLLRIDEASTERQQVLCVGVCPNANSNQEVKNVWQVGIIRSNAQLRAHSISHGPERNALADVLGHLQNDFPFQDRDCGKLCCAQRHLVSNIQSVADG